MAGDLRHPRRPSGPDVGLGLGPTAGVHRRHHEIEEGQMEPRQAARQHTGRHQPLAQQVRLLVPAVRQGGEPSEVKEMIGDEPHPGGLGHRPDAGLHLPQAPLVTPAGEEVGVVVPEQQCVAVVAEPLRRLRLPQARVGALPPAAEEVLVDPRLRDRALCGVGVLTREAPAQRLVGGIDGRRRPEQEPRRRRLSPAAHVRGHVTQSVRHPVGGPRGIGPRVAAQPRQRGHPARVLRQSAPSAGIARVHAGEQQLEVDLFRQSLEGLDAALRENIQGFGKQGERRSEVDPVALVHVDHRIGEERAVAVRHRASSEFLDERRGVGEPATPCRHDGGPDQAPGVCVRVGAQSGGTVHEHRALGVTAACGGVPARLLQPGGEGGVGQDRRRRLVGEPPGVVLLQTGRQDPPGRPPPLRRGEGDHRAAHQRMAEGEGPRRVHVCQLARLDVGEDRFPARSGEDGRPCGRVLVLTGERGQEQDVRGLLRQGSDPVVEEVLQPVRRGRRRGGAGAGPGLGAVGHRQFEQGERIARGLRQHGTGHVGGQDGIATPQQCLGGRGLQGPDA